MDPGMRTARYVAFASVLVALVAAAPAPGVLAPYIAGAQVALRSHGLYPGPIDGIRGPQTNRAIRTFQRRRVLQVDGVVGPRTRAKLGRLGRPLFGRRLIRHGHGRLGRLDAPVHAVEARRRAWGHRRDLRASTLGAVRRFQGGGPRCRRACRSGDQARPPRQGGPSRSRGVTRGVRRPRRSARCSAVGRAITASAPASRARLHGWSRASSGTSPRRPELGG